MIPPPEILSRPTAGAHRSAWARASGPDLDCRLGTEYETLVWKQKQIAREILPSPSRYLPRFTHIETHSTNLRRGTLGIVIRSGLQPIL